MDEKEPTTTFTLRVEIETLETVAQRAKHQGMTAARYVRDAIREKLLREIKLAKDQAKVAG